MKRLAKEENGNQILFKKWSFGTNRKIGMKILGDLKLFKSQDLREYSQDEDFESIILRKLEDNGMSGDTWAKRWPCTCHGEDQIPLIPCKANSAAGSRP